MDIFVVLNDAEQDGVIHMFEAMMTVMKKHKVNIDYIIGNKYGIQVVSNDITRTRRTKEFIEDLKALKRTYTNLIKNIYLLTPDEDENKKLPSLSLLIINIDVFREAINGLVMDYGQRDWTYILPSWSRLFLYMGKIIGRIYSKFNLSLEQSLELVLRLNKLYGRIMDYRVLRADLNGVSIWVKGPFDKFLNFSLTRSYLLGFINGVTKRAFASDIDKRGDDEYIFHATPL